MLSSVGILEICVLTLSCQLKKLHKIFIAYFKILLIFIPDMMVHACCPSTWRVVAGESGAAG